MDKKILIVDDEKPILEALRRMFSVSGYSPYYALNGKEALAVLENEDICVCFVDLRMPGMDGAELCRRIKQLKKDSRVYALSAYTDAYEEKEFREMGFDGWFKKPFKYEELIRCCCGVFDEMEKAHVEPGD